jgi:hypothetical protein
MVNRQQSERNRVTLVRRAVTRVTAVVAALYCCGAGRMSAQTTSAFTEVDRVRGVVINSITREPVSRAVVSSPDNAFATMTDDRGRFEFAFPRPEPASSSPSPTQDQPQIASRHTVDTAHPPSQLIARKIGYLPATEATDISQITSAHADVTMVLVPEGRIVGHVVVPGWDGFGKIQVDVYRRTVNEGREQWDMAGTAGTRADGEFRVAALPPGSYKLFTHEHLDNDPLISYPQGPLIGYPPVYFPGASNFDSAAVIHLAAGESFEATMTPVKKPYYPVKVGFTQPLATPQLRLQVWPQGHPGPGFSLGYNQQEGQIQGSLPEGVYSLLVAVYGENVLAGTLNMVIKGGPFSGASLSLFPASAISVNVTQEFQHTQLNVPESAPTGPASAYNPRRPNYLGVSLIPEEQFSLAAPATLSPPRGPEDETLIIDNVMPGRYRVIANTSAFGYVALITSGGTDLLRQPLVVGAGAAVPPIEVVVRDDGANVEGTIELPNSSANFKQPSAGSHVVYFMSLDRPSDQPRLAFVGPGEGFTTPQLPPGAYRVFALDRQRAEVDSRDNEFLKRYESKAQIIYVDAEQKLHLRLPLITVSE